MDTVPSDRPPLPGRIIVLMLKVGEWTFHPERNILRANGVERHLEPKQAEVLARLCATPGEVVSKSELLDGVWSGVFVTEEVLTNSIYQLRRAFGDSAREQRYIETIPKRGYRLVAKVSNGAKPAPRRRWLALGVAAAMAIVLLLTVRAMSGAREQREAADLVARGERLLDAGSDASAIEALRHFEQAAEIDPRRAAAWAGLAAARWSLVSRGTIARSIGLVEAEEAARHAIALDPRLARPWETIGAVHAARWEWSQAQAAFVRAIELEPRSARAYAKHAELLLLTDRAAEAKSRIAHALSLEPHSRHVLMTAGFIDTMLRDSESAARAYRSVLERNPEDAEARKQLEKVTRSEPLLSEGSPLTPERIDSMLAKQPLRPAVVAGLFAEAGEDERALAWLRRAREEKDLSFLLVRLDTRWTRLHSDPRFRAILDGRHDRQR